MNIINELKKVFNFDALMEEIDKLYDISEMSDCTKIGYYDSLYFDTSNNFLL